ncbi:MAG: sugar transferase [Prevotella sp.]|nr:sugar transferase [Prevotella sp.]
MISETDFATTHDRMGKLELWVKRFSDIVCSIVGLILLSPVFLVIAILMKRQKNGTIFFRQERIGYGGKPFTIYKFRTMSSVIEDDGPQLVAKSDSTCSTPLERFLRDHHLDELPQLWNVLKGDMSLVGPRPERRYFIDKIMEHDRRYTLIFEMRPGLTSEATLYNGYTDTMDKMLRRLQMDIDYLESRTLWLDAKIIFKTFATILSGRKF